MEQKKKLVQRAEESKRMMELIDPENGDQEAVKRWREGREKVLRGGSEDEGEDEAEQASEGETDVSTRRGSLQSAGVETPATDVSVRLISRSLSHAMMADCLTYGNRTTARSTASAARPSPAR